jgi:hypothetical protein
MYAGAAALTKAMEKARKEGGMTGSRTFARTLCFFSWLVAAYLPYSRIQLPKKK